MAADKPKTILLAEDSRVNQAVALAIVKKAGYRIDAVANGLEAVRAVRSHVYDLILMDLAMPEMDGRQATTEIRRLPPPQGRIPIIAMTAHDHPEDARLCLAAGMDDYVCKPIGSDTLLAMLERWLHAAAPAAGFDFSAVPALDLDRLSELEVDINPALLRQIVGLFVAETRERLEQIDLARRTGDWKRLEREAHTLKSSATTFGAAGLHDHARRLDRACQDGRRAAALELAEGLAAVALPTLEALTQRYRLDVPDPGSPFTHQEDCTLNAHAFDFITLDRQPLPLKAFAGHPLLVVNTASECGFTPQYAGLQRLWERYRERGLMVLGVPSNDFGNQEPASEDSIREFCENRYGVSFPLTSKHSVIGTEAHPFYRWIVEQLGEAGAPRWNFHKYLIGPDGELVETWPSRVEPLAEEITAAVERLLKPGES